MEDNSIKREYHAFHGHTWRSWDTKEPMISFNMSDGRNEATQFLNMEQAEEVIVLLQSLIEQAKALTEEDDMIAATLDDTPF
jgi:hypothetical protein